MKNFFIVALVLIVFSTVMVAAESLNWTVVRDDTLLLRTEEHPILVQLLKAVQGQAGPIGPHVFGEPFPVSYLQLEAQSEEYRGKMVAVSGKLLRVDYIPIPSSVSEHLKGLYNCWVQLPDNWDKPLSLLSITPIDTQWVGERVDATGVYIKRHLTSNDRSLITVPTILVVSLSPQTRSQQQSQQAQPQQKVLKASKSDVVNRVDVFDRDVSDNGISEHETGPTEEGKVGKLEQAFLSELLGYGESTWWNFTTIENPVDFPQQVIAKGLARLQQRQVSQFLKEQTEKWTPTLFSQYSSGIVVEFPHNVRLQRIEKIELPADSGNLFGFSSYYLCSLLCPLQVDGQETVYVVALTVPEQLQLNTLLQEPVRCFGVLLRTQPNPVILANRLEWYPDTLLGRSGMDVSTLDTVTVLPLEQIFGGNKDGRDSKNYKELQSALRLTEKDREPFYQLLDVSSRIPKSELKKEFEREWKQQGQDHCSVVNVFNNPHTQKGRLFRLRGIARRIDTVWIGDEEIQNRFGFDRYYQVMFFTEDSQDNPLVLCVKDLPVDTPLGSDPGFQIELEISAFFFKTWAYLKTGEAGATENNWQFAPLFIGQIDWTHLLYERNFTDKREFLPYFTTGTFVILVLVWIFLRRMVRKTPKPRFGHIDKL